MVLLTNTLDSNIDELISEVWREACRHIDMCDATANIGSLLAKVWPVRLTVCEIDTVKHQIVTIGDSQKSHASEGSQPCAATAIKKMAAWAQERNLMPVRQLRTELPAVARAVPGHVAGAALVGGLAGEHDAYGVLIIEPAGNSNFGAGRARFARRLLEPLSAALDNHHRLRELTELRAAAEADKQSLLTRLGRESLNEPVIGAADGLKGVFERVGKVCNSDLPVLILGETGSGKEVIAREIHLRSRRSDGPFIRVNCGAISPELIDSELFGHEKGSFTGATNQRRGWFERANHGTLFLDEVGELPPAAQVRLLRVLQDGLIQRVGGEQDVAVAVRIVAATHRDLPNLIQDGRFREDLWYRLATFPIVLPPLRERRGDILALAGHFARRAATRFGLRLQLPQPDDLLLLESYEWPGNVRELAAVMDRAAILGDGERLEVAKALGTPMTSVSAVGAAPTPLQNTATPADTNSAQTLTLDEAMRQHIETVLAATHGRVEGRHGAARILAINPHTLRARMRKLGVEWNRYKTHED